LAASYLDTQKWFTRTNLRATAKTPATFGGDVSVSFSIIYKRKMPPTANIMRIAILKRNRHLAMVERRCLNVLRAFAVRRILYREVAKNADAITMQNSRIEFAISVKFKIGLSARLFKRHGRPTEPNRLPWLEASHWQA
jgi:hypothetical protein